MFMVKVYCKIETSPWTLLLNQFQKRLNCLLLIGQKQFFLANQRRGAAGWLSCFLTRRSFPHQSHGCVARSTGKVSQRKCQNRVLTTGKIATCSTAARNKLSDEFLGRIFPRYRKFLLLIWYAMHDFHFSHLNLFTLSSIQHQAYILDVHVCCMTSETFYSVKISVARATQLRWLIVGNAA